MNSRTFPQTLRLQRTPWRSLTDRWLESAQGKLARWLERREQRREADLALAVEGELRHLDPRTLADIGAPQGLVGQQRWQAEKDDWRREQMLRSSGW